MNDTFITLADCRHRQLVKWLDDFASTEPPAKFVSCLHIGCGVPLFITDSEAIRRGRVCYRGVDESAAVVRAAGDHLPDFRFIHAQLDAMPLMAADVIIVGPGIFRMCGGGAEQLLRNLDVATFSLLAVATVPGADNESRESLVTSPRSHLPLDVVAMHRVGGCDPSGFISQAGVAEQYAVWEKPKK